MKMINTSRCIVIMRRFAADRRGGVMVMASLAAPFMIALVGLGVEGGLLYRLKRTEQTAADAAALAGAIERGKGATSAVTTAALSVAEANGFANDATTTVAVNAPPASGAHAGNSAAVEVVITRQQPKIFSLALLGPSGGDKFTTVASSSVAIADMTGDACVLALDPTASSAIKNSGSANINMDGCVIAANSNDTAAISIGGSSSLTAESLWTAGNYTNGGSGTVTLSSPAKTNMWALSDPYASLSIPSPGSCTATNKKANGGPTTLSPGTYCKGIDIGANAVVTLTPGTYYIDGGDLKVNGQATVKCPSCSGAQGVTFVLTSSGAASDIGIVDINGGADVKLQAPTDGVFGGLLIVQDRKASSSKIMKLNGGSEQVFKGAVYAAAAEVQWSGNTDTTSAAGCIEIIARLVTFIGNSKIDNVGCEAMGVKPIRITASKLVQ